ncbi:MAG TPA: HDIG domain-containing protein [Gemmatimonadales bacterium]|nr:HDIG domain-containing protein [Gemmatimonadales bacterium]
MSVHVPTREKVRYHAARWAWVLALALVAQVSFPSSSADVAPLLEPGARADKEIVAPFNFVVNKSEDELQRESEELAASAKPIYEFRQHAYDSAATTMAAFFSTVDAVSDRGPQAIIRAAGDFGVPLSLQEAAYLAKGGKRRALQQALERLFDRTLAQGVTAAGVLQVEQSRELIVRRGSTESSVQRDRVLTFAQYLNRAKQLHPDAGSSVGDVLYLKLVRQFFRPTLIPKQLETERRRNELRGSVDPSKYIVRAGDRIVAPHEIVTNEAHERLVALHQELLRRGAATTYSIRGVLGPLLRDALIISIFWVLLVFYRRETYTDLKQVVLIGGLFAVLLGQAGLVARFYPAHPEVVFMPFLAMMMTVLFNGRVSMIAAMILSVVIGLQPVFHDVPATFLCVVGGVTAALSVKTLRSRSNFYAPVLIIAAGYLSGALALGLASGWPIEEIGLRGLWGALNGLVSAGLTFFLLPVAESVTHITTDLTLLELSDPSRPLLRRLSLEAPGTYAHSVAMANLVEAACNRIGANGLLGRVGCYYHDIGKVKNPLYFVENQIPGNNPHDRLKPLQSAQIIKAHVTDGLVLAAEAGLPDVVAAFIPEHHGTTEITYFLDKAKKTDGGQARNPEDFTYPGPKPRSMETAIAMIADSVEAALRVLEDLTPQKIEEAIDHIVRTKVNAGQLDEAPLTLQQIEQVKAAFLVVLSGMYHNRIDYPEASGGIGAAWQPPPETARTSR